jgi:rhodanese-related sulfurtransferase
VAPAFNFVNAATQVPHQQEDSMFTIFNRRRARKQTVSGITVGSTDEMGSETITKSCPQLVTEASAAIETIPAAEAMKELHQEGVVFIDVRDLPELERDGKIPGAVHASRGWLEFYADPHSPVHMDVFASGQKLILYCASGPRSALATQRLQEMGLHHVAQLSGGLKAWKAANGPVEAVGGSVAVD